MRLAGKLSGSEVNLAYGILNISTIEYRTDYRRIDKYSFGIYNTLDRLPGLRT